MFFKYCIKQIGTRILSLSQTVIIMERNTNLTPVQIDFKLYINVTKTQEGKIKKPYRFVE